MAAALHTLDDVSATLAWLRTHDVKGLTTDSRRVQAGDAFIAWPGYASDGRQYVPGALQDGALACLVEAGGAETFDFKNDPRVAALRDLKALTGELADAFYGEPSRHLDVLAITGTNGKTSTAWWLAQALKALGRGAGVIGTLGVGVPPKLESTGLTTPDPVTLHATLRRFASQGLAAAAIEASSIGIIEHRMAGARLAVALFTNFTQDHLDYHGTMEDYRRAKAMLFDWPGLRHAVVNIDDDMGRELSATLRTREGLNLITYGLASDATLRAERVGYVDGGLAMDVVEDGQRAKVRTQLIGDFNVFNLLAVIGGLRAEGVSLTQATQACSRLTPVPGRMQRVASRGGEPLGVVDYAHSPDALEKALRALRPLAAARLGRLWCVFGCGGNRDTGKRPLMGAIAEREADAVVVTSDNPRLEDPNVIIDHIMSGLRRRAGVEVIVDRRRAIERVIAEAGEHDVVLIAGKGHETYQDVAGVKHTFSDVDVTRNALRLRGAA